jgi:glycosyltransferase 2 family protein
MARVNWIWLAVSVVLTLLTNVCRALRWQVMLRPFGHPLGIWRLTSDTAIGLTAGVLIGRVGEVVRPYLIAVQTGLPFSSQVAAWLLERVLDLLAVLLVCAYALIRLPGYRGHLSPKMADALLAAGYSLAIGGLVCVAVLILFRDPARRPQRRLLGALTFLAESQQARAARMLDAFSTALECTRDARSLTLLAGYTLLAWALIVAGAFALFRGLQATQNFRLEDVLVLLAFMTLGSVLQVPGVGGGMQAAAIIGLNSLYGLPLEAASGIAVLLWVVSSIAIVPFGLACAFHEGLSWSKLKLLSAKQITDLEA